MKKTLVALALAGLTCLGAVSTANAFLLQNGDTSFKLSGKLNNALTYTQNTKELLDTITLDYKLALKGALNDGYSYEFSTDTSKLFGTARVLNQSDKKFYSVQAFNVKNAKLILKNANNTFQAGAVKDNFDAPVVDFTANDLNSDKVSTTKGLYYGYSDDLNSYSVSYSFTPTSDENRSRLLSLNYLYNVSSELNFEGNLVVGNKTADDLFQGKLLNNTISLDLATDYTGVENLEIGANLGLLYSNVRNNIDYGSPTDKYLLPALSTQFAYTTEYVVPTLNLASNIKIGQGLNTANNKYETTLTYENIVGLSVFVNKNNSPYFKTKHSKTKATLYYTNDYTPSVSNVTESVSVNKLAFDVVLTGTDAIPYVIPTYKFSYAYNNSKTGNAEAVTTKNSVTTSLNLESNVAELNAYVTPSIKEAITYDFNDKSLQNDLTLTLDSPTYTLFNYYGDNAITLDAELSYTLSTSKTTDVVTNKDTVTNTNSGEFDLTFKY